MKILLLRKKILIAAAVVVAVTVAAVAFSGSVTQSAMATLSANKKVPIYSVKREDNKASISFDAAWGNEDTQTLIDILARYNVKATFFVVGEWVDKYPESVKALHDAGHEVMNHSDTHPYLTKLSAEQILAQANACSDKIEAVTGERPILLRPPYGDYNDTVINTLNEAGYYPIQWSVDSLDWKGIGADEIVRRVVDKVEPGSIVLFHNAAIHTPEALPTILEAVAAKGIELEKISELIYRDHYKIDHTGQQYRIEALPEQSLPDASSSATSLSRIQKKRSRP